MTDLLVATRNPAKLIELRRLLDAAHVEGIRVLGLADVAEFPEEPETGATFAENALAKARDAAKATGLAAVADPNSSPAASVNSVRGTGATVTSTCSPTNSAGAHSPAARTAS